MPILTHEYRFAADEHNPHVKIIKYVDKGKRVLDVGCATGSFSILLARPIIYLTILGLTFPIFVAKQYITELRSFTSDLKIAGPLLSRLLKIELRMAEIVQGSG